LPFCITVSADFKVLNYPRRHDSITSLVLLGCIDFREVQLNHHREGSGPPLVLIHGIGSRWQMWEPVLKRLAAERDVVALDLPGFGASPMPPPGTRAGLESLTRLVIEFLGEIGLDRPHVAGNSLGGWISLDLARQGAVRSATALSPAGFHNRVEAIYERVSLWLAAHGARLLAPRSAPLAASPRWRKALFGQMAAHPENVPASDVGPTLHALANAPWFDDTLTALVDQEFTGGEQIAVPVTIAWGKRDRLLLPRQAPRAARRVPRARMVTEWGCGHVPTYDDPEQIARILLEGSAAG
jgi:pimeloyl-ACP methyl ester carboxylesterase